MKKIFIAFLALSNTLQAQYSGPALRMGTEMSLSTLQGTARFVGSGGVMGSVGGDISNLNTNPAGLGMFSRSELEFTPALSINNSNTNYILTKGSTQSVTNFDINRYKFTINSVGIVLANRVSENGNFRASNITLGINRTADFNHTCNFGMGVNRTYSYANALSSDATYLNGITGFPPSGSYPISSDFSPVANFYNQVLIARNAELIFYNQIGNYYEDPTDISKVDVSQFGQVKTTGGITEISAAWSGNIKDKAYIGVSMGLPIINYQTEFTFDENNYGSTVASPNSFYGKYTGFSLSETDAYSGVGINLKIGGLVKLTEFLKASAYIHSPTFSQITNDYLVSITSKYEKSTIPKTQAIDDYSFNYISPFKFGGGLSYLIGKKGFIGAEYEYTGLDGLTIELENEAQYSNTLNNALKDQNQNVHTFKVGGEFVIDNFRLRGGYNYRTSPTTSAYVLNQGDRVAHTFTGGIGYRGKRTSLDLSYMKTQFKDYRNLYAYDANIFTGYSSWNSINQIVATINFRFQ